MKDAMMSLDYDASIVQSRMDDGLVETRIVISGVVHLAGHLTSEF